MVDKKNDTKYLKNKNDYRTLLWVYIYFVITINSWIWFNYFSFYIKLLSIFLLSYFSFACSTIVHNTIHHSVFKNNTHNKIFEILLSLSYGHPVLSFVPGHNKSHHLYTQSRKDFMRTSKLRYKWNLLNFILFQPTVAPKILSNDIMYIMSQKETSFYYNAIDQFKIIIFTNLFLLYLNPCKFLLLFYIPHLFAQWFIVSINMIQHDGCDIVNNNNIKGPITPLANINTARNLTGSIINYLTFNNGYHMMHHLKPALHWSELPKYHDIFVKPFNHPNLNQPNMLTYIWSSFIYPGERIDYLGNPIIYNANNADDADNADEPWFHLKQEKNNFTIYKEFIFGLIHLL